MSHCFCFRLMSSSLVSSRISSRVRKCVSPFWCLVCNWRCKVQRARKRKGERTHALGWSAHDYQSLIGCVFVVRHGKQVHLLKENMSTWESVALWQMRRLTVYLSLDHKCCHVATTDSLGRHNRQTALKERRVFMKTGLQAGNACDHWTNTINKINSNDNKFTSPIKNVLVRTQQVEDV